MPFALFLHAVTFVIIRQTVDLTVYNFVDNINDIHFITITH